MTSLKFTPSTVLPPATSIGAALVLIAVPGKYVGDSTAPAMTPYRPGTICSKRYRPFSSVVTIEIKVSEVISLGIVQDCQCNADTSGRHSIEAKDLTRNRSRSLLRVYKHRNQQQGCNQDWSFQECPPLLRDQPLQFLKPVLHNNEVGCP